MTNHLLEIKQYGQSIWMDNLTRDLIQSGELKKMVEEQGICGITSNPATFEKAIVGNAIYDQDIEACADHCDVADRVESKLDKAYQTIESLKDPDVKIDLDRVMSDLLTEGIDKFVQPFQALMNSLEEKVKKLQPVS